MRLEDYHFLECDREKIEYDQYGRPYIRENIGRFYLSKRTKYEYE